jgi:hypothetical protein
MQGGKSAMRGPTILRRSWQRFKEVADRVTRIVLWAAVCAYALLLLGLIERWEHLSRSHQE